MNKKVILGLYEQEILAVERCQMTPEFAEVWLHLERAHILSQPFWKKHFYVHCLMLKFAIKQRNFEEILGQIPRILLAAPSSFLRIAPRGNPGTTRVGIFTKVEIPPDFKDDF